ncbi:YceD family protein [Sphingomonas yantingensis]|uniref:Uncharacterized metal-binding protein YceD (DUF177 family) n=1 Tax=Sphingomonas yantingensis TaxID=1241761 RepID=A0A7W9AMU8_9SPHN|nr:YceD family protein [Sphingomonas yantingensis]MBB5697177.1 uncharacterized metal-binding protein YceD (DUF177 family) [Sphingomonas yantingensis]
MTPEFSRPLRLDQIGAGDNKLSIDANEAERAALARRFELISLDSLHADYAVRRDAAGVLATGRLTGKVVQACVATAAPVPATIDEAFTLRFLPEPGDEAPEEVELDEADCDTMFYTGSAIDLGEAAAETLALALDPFPRAPGAEEALREAGVIEEGAVTPLSGLAAALQEKLKK